MQGGIYTKRLYTNLYKIQNPNVTAVELLEAWNKYKIDNKKKFDRHPDNRKTHMTAKEKKEYEAGTKKKLPKRKKVVKVEAKPAKKSKKVEAKPAKKSKKVEAKPAKKAEAKKSKKEGAKPAKPAKKAKKLKPPTKKELLLLLDKMLKK
jgi:hypothetical protein